MRTRLRALPALLLLASTAGGAESPPSEGERPATTAQPGQPASTLAPDALDAPAPVAVGEAARAAELAADAGTHHHHGTYRHEDAGRDHVVPDSGPGREALQTPVQPQTPGSGAHEGHAAPATETPAPATAPAPGGHDHHHQETPREPAAKPAPGADPHAGHDHAAPAPKPTPAPTPKPSPRPREHHR